jgi:hypothetical protein
MFINALLNPESHLEILKTPGMVEISKSPRGDSHLKEKMGDLKCHQGDKRLVHICALQERQSAGVA